MKKTVSEIRNELLSAFLALEEVYSNSSTSLVKKTYIDIEMCEHLMNAIKSLKYHYMEDLPEMRTKRKWGPEMVRAQKLLEKYSELKDSENPHSKLELKSEFDDSGYLENRDFLIDAIENRKTLKRNL